MGLFGKLKDAVGIGSLKAEVQFNAPGFNPGDSIAGKVLLHQAASDTKVTSVLLQLTNIGTDVETTDVLTDDYWYGAQWETYEQEFKYNSVLFEMYLAQDFVVTKGQKLELPFDITTPPDVLPTDKYNKYIIKVHVDIPGKIDTKCAKPVHIMTGGAMPVDDFGPQGGPGDDLPAPGERILAYYEDAWYECTVAGIHDAGISVAWDDGTDSMVGFDQILPSESAMPGPADLGIGMRVMARYDEGFYEASISAISGAQIGIQWDDGSQSWVTLADVRLL